MPEAARWSSPAASVLLVDVAALGEHAQEIRFQFSHDSSFRNNCQGAGGLRVNIIIHVGPMQRGKHVALFV